MDTTGKEGEFMGTQEDHDLLLRLEGKMDMVLSRVESIHKLAERVGSLENKYAATVESVDTLEKEVEKLRSTSTVWSIVNSVAVAIATYLGVSR